MEEELNHYINNIKNGLICSSKEKKKLMRDLKESIDDYMDCNDVNEIEQIYAQFGSVEDIVTSTNAMVNSKALKKAINWKKTVVLAVIAMIALFAIFLATSFLDVHKSANGYYVEGPAEELTTQANNQ